jgi:cytochrome c-type biogenesis protein CcmH/NrfF
MRTWVGRIGAVLVAAGFVLALVLAAHGSPPTVDQRAHRLDRELRCPVCQGLSVADSPSSTSAAIAADVRRRVVAGESDQEIRDAYVARYGRWILLTPGGGVGAGAFVLPIAGIAVAVVVIAVSLRRWSRRPERAPTDDDLALVAGARRRNAVPGGGST